jgi:choline dehydrogenase-like flavoprotein
VQLVSSSSTQGELKQLRATREVLLCAGALQSPQILMLSGIGPHEHLLENGIATLHHLPGVGQNLHDHPDVVINTHAPRPKDLMGISLHGMVQAVKGIFEWRRQRTGMLTTNFAEAGGFIKSAPDEAIPDLQLHFVIGILVDHGRKTILGHGYSCHVCLLRPLSRGSLRLASRDPADAPLIDPNFLADRDDMERLIRGFRIMRGILAQPALAAFGGKEFATSAAAQTDLEIEHFIRDHADTIYHPVGTCRMGAGPGRRGRRRIAGAWPARPARGGCVDHAARGRRQHECAGDHDRGEGGRHDQGGGVLRAHARNRRRVSASAIQNAATV